MNYLFRVPSYIKNAFTRFSAVVSAGFPHALAIVTIVRGIPPSDWTQTVFLGILAKFSPAFRAVRLLRGESVGPKAG